MREHTTDVDGMILSQVRTWEEGTRARKISKKRKEEGKELNKNKEIDLVF